MTFEKLQTCLVKFEDSSYNYKTSVSAQCNLKNLQDYFVGHHLEMGVFPIEDIQVCIAVELV